MFAFDRMFDFNGDRHLDFFERALQFHVIDQTCREPSADSLEISGLSGFADNNNMDLFADNNNTNLFAEKNNADLFVDNDNVDVFADAGLDYEELEFMDPLQRRGVLRDAGLNPDEFDF